MLKIKDLKPNVLIELKGTPFLILSASWKLLGRGQGMTKTKLKNLKTGTIVERVFRGEEAVKEANLTKTKAYYLFKDKENFCFMDSQSMEQFSLPAEEMGFSKNFLKEGSEVEIFSFSGKPISVNLPIKINLKVKWTEPGVRGGRETPGTKKAILETGYALQVPLFIKEGDIIRVDTREGKYVERQKF